MFIEIAFIQKFILFLSYPIYAVAVVLCAFLIFAGLGSRFSRHVVQKIQTMLRYWNNAEAWEHDHIWIPVDALP